MSVPLSIFDLVPVSQGQTGEQALKASLDLARAAEEWGYHRLWYGEHHLNPGVIGYSPTLLIALAGAVTSRLRLGSGAVLAGQRNVLTVAEEFSLLQAAYGDRIDLGLGRAALRRNTAQSAQPENSSQPFPEDPPSDAGAPTASAPAHPSAAAADDRLSAEGLFLPAAPDLSGIFGSQRTAAAAKLLLAEGAVVPDYGEFIDQLIALLENVAEVDGIEFNAATAQTTGSPQLWVLGSSAGESAEVAGHRGLRFGANYHVAPSNVTDAVQHYRETFRPSKQLNAPYVIVSAEVLVAESREEAERLSAGYAPWVHSIRAGDGAIAYPPPESADDQQLCASQATLVRDRVATRFIGTGDDVAEQLSILQRATGADELLISTSAYRLQDRIRSYQLLAQAWETHNVALGHKTQ